MDPRYITPFIKSIQNVFGTMLQLPVEVGEPSIKSGTSPTHDVSGIIGMSGDVTGSIVLSFESGAAESIVALFAGEQMSISSPDFADAIGELVNMVSGGAKALFPDGSTVSISCPSVVTGSGHTVTRPSDIPCVVVPCSTDCGEVVIEIAIREPAGAEAGVSNNAAQA